MYLWSYFSLFIFNWIHWFVVFFKSNLHFKKWTIFYFVLHSQDVVSRGKKFEIWHLEVAPSKVVTNIVFQTEGSWWQGLTEQGNALSHNAWGFSHEGQKHSVCNKQGALQQPFSSLWQSGSLTWHAGKWRGKLCSEM